MVILLKDFGRNREKECGLRRKEREGGLFSDDDDDGGSGCSPVTAVAAVRRQGLGFVMG